MSSGSERTAGAISLASGSAFAGHLLALIAAVTDSVPPNTAIVAAVACSIIALAALAAFGPQDVRVQRAVTALTAGHGLAAAIMVLGVAPGVPWSMPLAGLGAAATLGGVFVIVVGHASRVSSPSRPLTMAPRVAAVVLVVQALVQRWVASASGLSMPLRAAIFLSIVALGIALVASLSVIALRLGSRWAIAGVLAWTVGWVAVTADLVSLVLASLGQPSPVAPHQLHPLGAVFAQSVATAGGLVIGAALVTSIRDVRFRHSAIVLLVGYAALGVVAAVAEHRIAAATDFPSIAALRSDRDLANAIASFPLAGVLWLYWRRVYAR